jgi:hypothetical protein
MLPPCKGTTEKFKNLFDVLQQNVPEGHSKIDAFIRQNTILLSEQKEKDLVSELYRMPHFDWGGDYKNALDKYLIDSYVKQYASYFFI